MSLGSWPFIPGQCDRCAYLHAPAPPHTDDDGYEVVGFCRHPRIAMDLFRAQKRRPPRIETCPLFVAKRDAAAH
jgi:hypothetical protein